MFTWVKGKVRKWWLKDEVKWWFEDDVNNVDVGEYNLNLLQNFLHPSYH